MISVKELMIGDLVNYRPGWINEETNQVEYESGTGFPVRIEMLYYSHGEGLVQYNDGENDGIEAAEYELFPVPLTDEILEKNFPEPTDGITWYPEDGGFNCHTYIPKCEINAFGLFKYVHQLQHALRLCEIEKEIII
jgi:hypothetical protein